MESLIFPALLFLVMYVALILPQQRKQKAARELLASLSEGDEVITTSGIHGFVNELEPDVVWLDVSNDVVLKMSRSAIAGKIVETDEGEGDDESGVGDTDEIPSSAFEDD